MKKITTLLLIVFHATLLLAQDVRIDSVYHSFYITNQGIFVNKSVFTYNELGLKTQENTYVEEEDHWRPSKTTTFAYNDKGLLTKKVTISPYSKPSHTQEIYHYKDTMLVQKIIQKSFDGVEWETSNYWMYQHNMDNRRIIESTYNKDSIEDRKIEYIYDVKGNIVQEKQYIQDNDGTFKCVFRLEFIYDTNSHLTIKKEFYEGKILKIQSTYDYDANGHLTQKYDYMLFEGVLRPFTRKQYENNADGKPVIEYTYSYSEKNGWTLSFKDVKSYDTQGNLTNKSAFIYVQNTWFPSNNDETWIYFYNKGR